MSQMMVACTVSIATVFIQIKVGRLRKFIIFPIDDAVTQILATIVKQVLKKIATIT